MKLDLVKEDQRLAKRRTTFSNIWDIPFLPLVASHQKAAAQKPSTYYKAHRVSTPSVGTIRMFGKPKPIVKKAASKGPRKK